MLAKELQPEDRIFVSPRGVGYHIDILSATATVVRLAIIARDGRIVLDEFDVPRERALDAMTHPSLYSDRYREALT